MRKFFTAVVAAVLATGALQTANADTALFTDDPTNFINIIGINDIPEISSGGALAEGAELLTVTSERNPPFYDGPSGFHYTMKIEIKKQDTFGDLDQASICFFDTNRLTDAAARLEVCGTGIDAQGDTLDFSGTKTGQSLPQSAMQVGFIPRITPTSVASPIQNIDPGLGTEVGRPNHEVQPKKSSGSRLSSVELTGVFDGVSEGVADDSVYSLGILFRPSYMAHNTGGWKIRVLATYLDSETSSPVTYELVSEQSWGIAYSSALEVNQRGQSGQVDYGELFPGTQAVVKGIDTVTYRANNLVDITLNPSVFKAGETTVQLGTTGLEADKVTVECGPDEDSLQVLSAGTAVKIFTALPGVSAVGHDARVLRIAPTHDCALSVGSDVPAGDYTNVVTAGVGPSTG